MSAVTFTGDGRGTLTEADVPAAMADQAADEARAALVEMVAETNDSLMEVFFEPARCPRNSSNRGCGTPRSDGASSRWCAPPGCARSAAAAPRRPRALRPVAGRARRSSAIGPDGNDVPVAPSATAPHAAFVWKTLADPFAGRITMLRVIARHLQVRHHRPQPSPATRRERLGHLLALQGKTQTHVTGAARRRPGRRGEAEGHRTPATCSPSRARRSACAPLSFPEPVLSYAIEPKSRGDEDKISTSMHRLQEEDPSIGYSRDPQTHELLLAGQGQLHIEVTVAQAETALQRGGAAEAAADSLPGDDHGRDRSARPPQEADRRPRSVRRLQDPRRAAAARQRLRSSRTTSSAAPSRGSTCRPSRRASRTRACAASWPASRWWTSRPRSSTARSTRWTRTSCRSRWPARWRSRTPCRAPSRPSSSRS